MREREEDHMVEFVKKNKPKENRDMKVRPPCRGLAPPSNRLNIWLTYHQDGVRRSSVFEPKHFADLQERSNGRKCWSVDFGYGRTGLGIQLPHLPWLTTGAHPAQQQLVSL